MPSDAEVAVLRDDVERVREALMRCKDHRDELEDERDRYREALIRIADGESGSWGWIAHYALHPERDHGTGVT